jgi:ligand-binding sensor domain-containing protein
LWIGTNIGLVRRNVLSGEEWLVSKESSKLRSNEITCGICLPDGRAYIGTKDELLYWNNKILIQITNLNSTLSENYIRELMVDQQENIWLRTLHGQVGKAYGSNVKMLKPGMLIPSSCKIVCKSQEIPSIPTLDSMDVDSTYFIR